MNFFSRLSTIRVLLSINRSGKNRIFVLESHARLVNKLATMLAADRPSSCLRSPFTHLLRIVFQPVEWKWIVARARDKAKFKSFGFSTEGKVGKKRRDQLLIQEGGQSPRDRYDLTVYTPVYRNRRLPRMESYVKAKPRRLPFDEHGHRTIVNHSPSIFVREKNRRANTSQSRTFDRWLSIIYLEYHYCLSDPIVVAVESVAQKTNVSSAVICRKKFLIHFFVQ